MSAQGEKVMSIPESMRLTSNGLPSSQTVAMMPVGGDRKPKLLKLAQPANPAPVGDGVLSDATKRILFFAALAMEAENDPAPMLGTGQFLESGIGDMRPPSPADWKRKLLSLMGGHRAVTVFVSNQLGLVVTNAELASGKFGRNRKVGDRVKFSSGVSASLNGAVEMYAAPQGGFAMECRLTTVNGRDFVLTRV